MGSMTDIMVDVETTGLNPHTSSIIQLAGIKFNADTGEVGEYFDGYPAPLPFRGWHDGTRKFWLEDHRAVYDTIITRQTAAEPVFRAFDQWVSYDAPDGGYRFWAKPITFDWNFVASHMEQLGMEMPFHYRYARDLNSYAAGMSGSAEHPDITEGVEFHGDEHNALHDCAFQIDCLLNFKKRFLSTEVLP